MASSDLEAPLVGSATSEGDLTQPGLCRDLTQPGLCRDLTQPGLCRDLTQPGLRRAESFAAPGYEAVAIPDEKGEVAGMCGIIVVSFLCTFMGAADGLSLGGLVFPADADHPNTEFKHLGMCLGLLTALIANLTMALGSGFRFAVGGAIIPMVAVMADFFKSIGPAEPETILVAIGLVTLLTGVLFLISGSGVPVQEVVDNCPYVVFGGFLAGTGVLLLNFGFNLMLPEFTSVLDFGPTGVRLLFTIAGGKLIWAPVAGALAVFFIDRWELAPSCIAHFVLPITMLVVAVGFYMVLFVSGVTLDEAREGGWLFATEIPTEIDFYKIWSERDFSKVKWNLFVSVPFLIGVFKAYLIGLLTITQNVFGCKKEAGVNVDVAKEIRLHGWIGIISGALGGLPGCIVMGFTCTAKSLGSPVKGKPSRHVL
jgi:MFS superfamily sulfate permease-like transporter